MSCTQQMKAIVENFQGLRRSSIKTCKLVFGDPRVTGLISRTSTLLLGLIKIFLI